MAKQTPPTPIEFLARLAADFKAAMTAGKRDKPIQNIYQEFMKAISETKDIQEKQKATNNGR